MIIYAEPKEKIKRISERNSENCENLEENDNGFHR